MSHDEEPVEDLKALEAVLASLVPRTGGLDRDRLMFLAGQASVRAASRFRWAWPASTAAMTAVAAGLLAMLALRLVGEPMRPVAESVVEAPLDRNVVSAPIAPERPAISLDGDDGSAASAVNRPTSIVSRIFGFPLTDPQRLAAADPYFGLRNKILRQGIETWNDSPLPHGDVRRASAPESQREILDSLLEDRESSKPVPGGPSAGGFISSGGHA
jgi:hypothetical protein